MELKIYNTLSRSTEPFVPLDPAAVRMFVCGPTVYGPMHAGHAKTYTQFDFIAKVLRRLYPSLRYVQNITDVDDKLIRKARAEGATVEEVARKWEQAYWTSMASLGNTEVDEAYRAHDHVAEVISQVERLLSLSRAYVLASSGVYYDLSTFPAAGHLARREASTELQSRLEDGVEKRNAGDFVLWKFAKEGEPAWAAPFGSGRPGWHIEDTAITEKHLGPSYDIHGGATDLIFPHHEAEIAQMEGITGQPLVNYWLHTGLLSVEGRKMGKSLHNFITVEELLAQAAAKTVRYAFLAAHYRSTMELSAEVLASAAAARERVENFYRSAAAGPSGPVAEAFWAAILEDFNTPRALAGLFTALRTDAVSVTRGDLEEINSLLSVFDFSEVAIPLPVEKLARERAEARRGRAWELADEKRRELASLGWQVRDEGNSFTLVPLGRDFSEETV